MVGTLFGPALGSVVGAIAVAGLGVLNDVTVTQASAIWRLHEVDPTMTWRELCTRGMAVGRDHIGPGDLLPAVARGAHLVGVRREIIRTVVGSIALVLAVPGDDGRSARSSPRPRTPRRAPPPSAA